MRYDMRDKMIEIHNENCFDTMSRMGEGTIDCVITSPPYNNGRGVENGCFYDEYKDDMSESEYRTFTINLFKEFDRIVVKNGIILYNISYHTYDPALPYKIMTDILEHTEWTVTDTIIWKKTFNFPINTDPRKLSRAWEFIWVFCRKSETKTYTQNRKKSKISPVGQQYYASEDNFITADNNDCATPELNQATFSTNLVCKLLDIYVKEGLTVYDPFMGTGTTAVACKKKRINCIGSELSLKQCEYARNRVEKTKISRSWFDEHSELY